MRAPQEVVGELLQAHPLSAPAARGAECGCDDDGAAKPHRIKWGLRNGVACERTRPDRWPANDTKPPLCGARCYEAPTEGGGAGRELVLFCPKGWSADCTHGCVLPPLLQQPRPGEAAAPTVEYPTRHENPAELAHAHALPRSLPLSPFLSRSRRATAAQAPSPACGGAPISWRAPSTFCCARTRSSWACPERRRRALRT